MIKCIFDLDGTLTTQETLPLIAKHFGIAEDMTAMTRQAIRGLMPFEESLRARLRILGDLPVDGVAKLLATVPLYTKIHDFIMQHSAHCIIATGNIDVWLAEWIPHLGCDVHCSHAHVTNNRITKLTSILDKKALVQHWQGQGYTVIFMGDGDNDVQAMLCADVAIAVSMTHAIAPHVAKAAQYVAATEEEAYALLCTLFARYASY